MRIKELKGRTMDELVMEFNLRHMNKYTATYARVPYKRGWYYIVLRNIAHPEKSHAIMGTRVTMHGYARNDYLTDILLGEAPWQITEGDVNT